MFAPSELKDIIIALIAGLFGGGLVFLVSYYRSKRAADLAFIQEKDKHEIDSGKLALEFIQELRGRIDQLNNRVACLEGELTKQREAAIMKDARIAELERKTQEQEDEIMELRKIVADKDELIQRLTARLDVLEKGKAVTTGRAR